MPERRIFVGDVQGCREELEELLELVRFDSARDELHPVGDFVNRGPDSAGVLRLAMRLGAGGVLGNHDLHLLRTADGTRTLGRRDTIQDVLTADDREVMLAWLARRPFYRSWPDVFLIHAGVNPRWESPRVLDDLDPLVRHRASDYATCVRHCLADGTLPAEESSGVEHPDPAFRPWFEQPRAVFLRSRTVVFGHWSTRGLIELPGYRGLDTGCVWGGKLSAWIAEEDRIVQVDARKRWSEP